MMYLYLFLYVIFNYIVVAIPMIIFLKTARFIHLIIGTPISIFLIYYAKTNLPKHYDYPFDDAFKYGLMALPILFLIGKLFEMKGKNRRNNDKV